MTVKIQVAFMCTVQLRLVKHFTISEKKYGFIGFYQIRQLGKFASNSSLDMLIYMLLQLPYVCHYNPLLITNLFWKVNQT